MGGRTDLPARFFKVILPSTTFQYKQRIPDQFVVKYVHELSNIVQIIDSTGSVWHLRLENTEKSLWFSDGWEQFVQEHSISVGYFLLFKYKGSSSFKVRVFDLTTTEIDYLRNGINLGGGSGHCTKKAICKVEEQGDASSPRKPGACSSRRYVSNEGRIDGVQEFETKTLDRSLSSKLVLEKPFQFNESKKYNRRKAISSSEGNTKSNENISSFGAESHLERKAVDT